MEDDFNFKKRKHHVSTGFGGSVTDLHHKNPYCGSPPDFLQLRSKFPDELGKYVQIDRNGKPFIDWRDQNAQRALTTVLLKNDFCFNVTIPADHLCPPLPNRINYLCWLSDLISSCDEVNQVRLLDIGVGPVCIYPLLGQRLFGWQFYGTDIDPVSIEIARTNLNNNRSALATGVAADSSIHVERVPSSEHLQQMLLQQPFYHQALHLPPSTIIESNDKVQIESCRHQSLHAFCSYIVNNYAKEPPLGPIRSFSQCSTGLTAVMTNPPFYDLHEQVQEREDLVCTASQREMRTVGGEVAFVTAMIIDSVILHQQSKSNVVWYTAMLGKKSSVRILLRLLTSSKYGAALPKEQVVQTTFAQGNTHRWGIGWTFNATAAAAFHRLHVTDSAMAQMEFSMTAKQLLDTQLHDEIKAADQHETKNMIMKLIVQRLKQSLVDSKMMRIKSLNFESDSRSCIELMTISSTASTSASNTSDATIRIELRDAIDSKEEAVDEVAVVTFSAKPVDKSMKQQFHTFYEHLLNDCQRTNRRWRRQLERDKQHCPVSS